MNHAKEIEAFVHRSFNMYGLHFKQFFSDMIDEEEDDDGFPTGGHLEELPIAIGEEIDMELLAQAAHTLGVSTEAFLQLDKDAVQCWYQKYPYFELMGKFRAAREHSLDFSSSPAEMLIDVIFNDNYRPANHRRYKGNIKRRLVELLKSYDAVTPGCYHEGCEIVHLSFETNNFTHFEQIANLVKSYLSMAERARELFYRLWDTELSEYEVREYNFLVSVLGMRDVGYCSKPIYYEIARKFAPIYKQEGYTDYLSYIMYRDADFPEVWACKEFYDYPELVEKMAQEFPFIKSSIGKMAVLAKNFYCSFVWSDEPEPPIEASYDEYLVGCLRSMGDDGPSWYHRVYVPKTEDELYDDEKYIAICEHLSAPASKGGLKQTIPECDRNQDRQLNRIKRMMARVSGGDLHG